MKTTRAAAAAVPVATAVGALAPVQATAFASAEVHPASGGGAAADSRATAAATMQCHRLIGEASQCAQMRQHKRAIQLCQQVLQECVAIGPGADRLMIEATALSTLGLVYQEKWADREAVQFHEEVLDIARESQSSSSSSSSSSSDNRGLAALEAATLTHLARLYRACGQDHLVYECEVQGKHTNTTAREKRPAVAKARNNGKKPVVARRGAGGSQLRSTVRAAMVCSVS